MTPLFTYARLVWFELIERNSEYSAFMRTVSESEGEFVLLKGKARRKK